MIWVVTNHDGTKKSLVPLIAAKGYDVSDIGCGDELLHRIRFQTPSLIIIDCGVTDSFDTLKTIRAESMWRQIPVVMFSIDDRNQMERALGCGANGYVPKGSLDWAELIVEVVRYAGLPPGAKGKGPGGV